MLSHNLKTIIDGCVKNDRGCQKQLYCIYAPGMNSLCMRYARNTVDAKDIFQSGFLRVFENIHQLRNINSVEWWIRKIFVNEAFIFYKKELKTIYTNVEETFSNKLIERNSIINDLELEYINTLIQNLPDKMRLVFNLYIIEGFSHQEIADQLNISIGTSKSNLHDARKILIKKINSHTQVNKAL